MTEEIRRIQWSSDGSRVTVYSDAGCVGAFGGLEAQVMSDCMLNAFVQAMQEILRRRKTAKQTPDSTVLRGTEHAASGFGQHTEHGELEPLTFRE